MDDKSYSIRVPKRWARVAMIVGVTALVVAPLTAIASHSFTDVPNSNTFHADIEWMKDSGVTKGCNPPSNTQYCPDDNVTRGQMAAFMNRFAGYIGAEDGTPAKADNAATADDADTLDGLNSSELRTSAAGTAHKSLQPGASTDLIPLTAGPQKILEIGATAPSSGEVLITYAATVYDGGGDMEPIMWVQIDDTSCNDISLTWEQGVEPGTFSVSHVNSTINWASQTASAVRPISSGAHTYTLCQQPNIGSGADLWDVSLSAVFFGTGSASVSEAGVSSSGGDGSLPLDE